MSILLLGDSHSDIFLNIPNTLRFNLGECRLKIFTTYRFVDPDDADLWSKLTPWFDQQTEHSKTLIITSGEIDIRAHYWKHMLPYGDLIQYITDTAAKFYQTLSQLVEKYKLERVVVWGAPVAEERARYVSEYPFGGSSYTRNLIVHYWNKEFNRISFDDPVITLATAYYDFINFDTYQSIEPSGSHDGVHWHPSSGPGFWEHFIMPAILGNKIVITNEDQIALLEQTSSGEHQYDSWVRTDHLLRLDNISKSVIIKDNSYSWVRAEQRNQLPQQYRELGLQKI
jgi:hypothetical protein